MPDKHQEEAAVKKILTLVAAVAGVLAWRRQKAGRDHEDLWSDVTSAPDLR